jgi:hypothetical protein
VIFVIARLAKKEIRVIRVTTAHLAPLVAVGIAHDVPRAHHGMIIRRGSGLLRRGWHANFWDRNRSCLRRRGLARLEARLELCDVGFGGWSLLRIVVVPFHGGTVQEFFGLGG